MGRRAAVVTQADIARAIRALQATGLPVTRVVVRGHEVLVETTAPEPPVRLPWEETQEDPAERRVPVAL